jgi:hypothetical protein
MIEQEVLYDHPSHKYHLHGTIYRSATQIIEQFVEHFDTEEQSQRMEYRYNAPAEYWKKNWKEENAKSLVRGDRKHAHEEDFMYNRGYARIHDKVFPVFNLQKIYYKSPIHYFKLPDGTYPELKLWRHDWKIAGRADKPTFETINKVRFAHIEDFKTNKRIRDVGFNGRKMLWPLEHLEDCELRHYTLQLSIYQYMLEYFGFMPGVRRIIHFPHEIEGLGTPKPVEYELPYLRDEVIAMLTHLKQIGWLN